MPLRDKTGPEGKGPKTGRGMGGCETPMPPKKKKMPTQIAEDVLKKRK